VIRKPIVIVTGAGASACYNFPVGAALKLQTIDVLAHNSKHRDFLIENTPYSHSHFVRFRQALLHSAQPSVDLFLEHRPEFTDIGKSVMAYLLASKEDGQILWTQQEGNWLVYLFNQMRAPFENFGINTISFVTFNYDRSIEHFLCTSLGASYGRSVEDCANTLANIPIIHLHGRLGYLPWQHPRARGYQPTIDLHGIRLCVDEMKIIHEDIADRDADFQRAKKLLHDAWRIYFLGFGYAPVNISRLDIPSLDIGKALGTGVDVGNAEHRQINRDTQGRITVCQNVDCIGLFRDYADWD
jgi:hypothetical protein